MLYWRAERFYTIWSDPILMGGKVSGNEDWVAYLHYMSKNNEQTDMAFSVLSSAVWVIYLWFWSLVVVHFLISPPLLLPSSLTAATCCNVVLRTPTMPAIPQDRTVQTGVAVCSYISGPREYKYSVLEFTSWTINHGEDYHNDIALNWRLCWFYDNLHFYTLR